MTKETELLLKDVVAKALGTNEVKEDNSMDNIAKAISAIATKVDSLSDTVVMKEVVTPETKIDSLTKTVESLAEIVGKIASGETIEKEAKLPESVDELNAVIAKAIKAAMATETEEEEEPEGEGSDDDLEKTLKKDKKEVSKEVDLSSIEKVDAAGNEISTEKRTVRKNLDDYFMSRISHEAK